MYDERDVGCVDIKRDVGCVDMMRDLWVGVIR